MDPRTWPGALGTRHGNDTTIATLLALAAVALRLPLRAQFLVNWDAVNFALGIGAFDLAAHQPHPPGYLGWVMLGRATTWLTGDPNAAMTLLSALSGAVATGLVYVLARRFVDRRSAIVAALLFTTAPLIWYYSVVALSYMLTGAVALGLLIALLAAIERQSMRHLVVAGVLLAAVGALRPTDQALLFPAWALAVFTFPRWRDRLRATVVMGLASLLWVVPLVVLSGGLMAFASQGSAVADLAGSRTWILGGNLVGVGKNVGMVVAGLVLGLFGGLAALVLARIRGIRPFSGLADGQRRLLLAWVVPALAVYVLIHTGQLGYVVLLLPAAYVGVARALPRLREARRARAQQQRGRRAGPRPAVAVTGLLAINVAAFMVLPSAGLEAIQASAAMGAEQPDPPEPLSIDRTRQYDVAANDAHWRQLVGLIRHHDPQTTAIVAETSSAGSFRHLSFYAADYHLFGLGWDLDGDLGYLFHARGRDTTYAVEQLRHAAPERVLPPDVRTVIVPDQALEERLVATVNSRLDEVTLADGSTATIVHLSAPAAIAVDNPPSTSRRRAEGFPSAATSAETARRQAEVRFVFASAVTEPRPVPGTGGLIP